MVWILTTIKLLREETERVRKSLQDLGADLDVDQMLGLDSRRRAILTELEELRGRRNQVSKEIGRHNQEGLDPARRCEDMKERPPSGGLHCYWAADVIPSARSTAFSMVIA